MSRKLEQNSLFGRMWGIQSHATVPNSHCPQLPLSPTRGRELGVASKMAAGMDPQDGFGVVGLNELVPARLKLLPPKHRPIAHL
ncbi:MAG: hypothetical protein ACPGLY_15140 [Rubripirellula sp.]